MNHYKDFLTRYHDDPVGFVEKVLKLQPQEWQKQLLRALARGERKITVAAGHGVGKSSVTSWAMIWFLLTRYPNKIVVTAPTAAQLFDALAAECKRWIKELPPAFQQLLTVKTERIELTASPTEAFISFRVSRSDQPEALQGIHSDNVLLVADEASGVPDAVFEAAYGSMSGESAHVVLLGNPIRGQGYFFDTHHKLASSWLTMRVSCLDSRLVSSDFLEEMREKYGENSNQWRTRVLGLFPLADDDTVIPRGLVEEAMKRVVSVPPQSPEIWGLDVARMGADASVLITRQGRRVKRIYSWRKLDLMTLAGRVHQLYLSAENPPLEVLIDSIGLGAGVYDRLRQLDVPVKPVNVSETPALAETYANLRAELWFRLKDWLSQDVSLPEHGKLLEDLCAPRYSYRANGTLGLERKEETAKRLGSSPDFADALCLTFASPKLDATGEVRPTRSRRKRLAGAVV